MAEVDEYIKTKEFTFCSRCGHICHLGGEDFVCIACSLDFPVDKSKEYWSKKEDIRMEKYESDFIIEFREKLAKGRMSWQK